MINPFRITQMFFIIFISLSCANVVFSCTRVLKADKGGAVIVGRNMDWLESMQANLMVYPQGIMRDGMAPTHSLSWISKYGSIIAVVYNTVTTDGMNEKGLAAHLLSLNESDYGKRDEKLPGISVLMWAQYYLDNFQTVDEAVRFTEANSFQLLPFYSSNVKKDINVHLALEDESGDSAIIEYINGKPIIYHSRDYKVVTNSPTYDQQLTNLKKYQGFGGDQPLPGTTSPADRFVRAAYYTAHLSPLSSGPDEMLGILSVLANVSQPYGIPSLERPKISYTIWRAVADLTHGTYYFNSLSSFTLVWTHLNKFNLLPGAPIMKLDLIDNPTLSGDVTTNFKPLS